MISAELYVRPLGKGGSCPHIIQADDGCEYVVKFKGNPQGTCILANEYICARLAEVIGLPVPPVVKMHVSDRFIRSEPHLAVCGFEGGLQFGARLIVEALDNPSQDVISACSNRSVFPGIIVFDHWVDNRDRAQNSDNLLAVRDGASWRLVMIDHGLALGGESESLSHLRHHAGAQIWGSVYEMFSQHIASQLDFEPYIQKVEGLNRAVFEDILMDTPQAWLPYEQRGNVVEYLDRAKSEVRKWLGHLGQYFPGWS